MFYDQSMLYIYYKITKLLTCKSFDLRHVQNFRFLKGKFENPKEIFVDPFDILPLPLNVANTVSFRLARYVSIDLESAILTII